MEYLTLLIYIYDLLILFETEPIFFFLSHRFSLTLLYLNIMNYFLLFFSCLRPILSFSHSHFMENVFSCLFYLFIMKWVNVHSICRHRHFNEGSHRILYDFKLLHCLKLMMYGQMRIYQKKWRIYHIYPYNQCNHSGVITVVHFMIHCFIISQFKYILFIKHFLYRTFRKHIQRQNINHF